MASNSRAFMTRLGDIETVFIQTNIARILLYNRYFHGDTIIQSLTLNPDIRMGLTVAKCLSVVFPVSVLLQQ